MVGYFGTETQQRLQALAESNADFIARTPGACQIGRMMGCDDPERFGWDRIDAILERDSYLGFRMISPAKAEEIREHLAKRNFRLDLWNVFLADRRSAAAACEAIVAAGLPEGLAEARTPTQPEDTMTTAIQALIGRCGIVPFSGSMLVGACGPARTVAIADGTGEIVAAAHGYMPHNASSPYHRHAWGGLAAVSEALRGRGLGSAVNARMLLRVLHDLGATHVYELASATNEPSRRMIAACGLRLEPTLVCGMAVPDTGARFTR
ncbi:GNAT family N-acetyltransferase [Prosthecomicrobium sp. N25]|uniref:GNAT family N-acetyltransferase n=1 Tax=Prosthecomicrobium sp. N25 TaxID=3129254 RepID=UPI0030777338